MMGPKRLKFSYHTIPVIWHDECFDYNNDLETVTECVDGDNGVLILKNGYRIHVARNSAASAQETLLHEVMHAIVRSAGLHRGVLSDRGDEEQVVTALAAGVIEVLCRNRGMGEFLEGAARRDAS